MRPFLLLACLGFASTYAALPPPISFWPIPINVSFGSGHQAVSPNLAFIVSPASASADVMAYATHVIDVIFMYTAALPIPPNALIAVNVNVANPNVSLQLGVDESYTLRIPDDGSAATITASTIYGAYMGLQTLSQVCVNSSVFCNFYLSSPSHRPTYMLCSLFVSTLTLSSTELLRPLSLSRMRLSLPGVVSLLIPIAIGSHCVIFTASSTPWVTQSLTSCIGTSTSAVLQLG
jgi:hypothetical protein